MSSPTSSNVLDPRTFLSALSCDSGGAFVLTDSAFLLPADVRSAGIQDPERDVPAEVAAPAVAVIAVRRGVTPTPAPSRGRG